MARSNDKKPKRKKSLEFNGKLLVSMQQPGPVMTTPYWRNTAKKPCEQATRGRNRCWVDAAHSDEHELEKYTKSACARVKGVFEVAPLRAMDTGRVELDFISEAQAQKYGVRAGPIMRLCHAGGTPGHLLPVTSPTDVLERSVRFNDCISRNLPDVARACGVEVAGPAAPLGRFGEFTSGGLFKHLLRGGR